MHDVGTKATVLATNANEVGTLQRMARQIDEMALRVTRRLIAPVTRGQLQLSLPTGVRTTAVGTSSAGGSDIVAHLALRRRRAVWRALRRGSIGFAEAYIESEVDSDDLVALFGYFIENRAGLQTAGRQHFRVRASDRAWHLARANSRSGSRRNITAHYDLGNAFYRLWLDPSLTYSSALFADRGMSLEAAQTAKNEAVLQALELSRGQRVLEIGCGWGALAARLAEQGAHVTALTLSREQFDAARALAQARGLSSRIDIRLEDYRDVGAVYDRIVSIEMIEAVGEENWPRYFAALRDRLAPDGAVVLQAITIDEAIYDTYRSKADFIQRFVFPGGMLPTKTLIEHHAGVAGFRVEPLLTFGGSYALTLAEWRRRFHANWPSIATLGFDERFRRMWDYYLAYCQAGFEKGTIDVGIYRLRPARMSEVRQQER